MENKTAPVLDRVKEKFSDIVKRHAIASHKVSVKVKSLTPGEAIGSPKRRDYALLRGREIMIEADYRESRGHAFTNTPENFDGTLARVLELNLTDIRQRAAFVAAVNAVCRHLGLTERTVHCRDEDPETCGETLSGELFTEFGRKKIVQIGFQPALLHHLVQAYSTENVRCIDLNPDNIGSEKSGIIIEDGSEATRKLIDWCDIALVTSSSIVNGTFDEIDEMVSLRGRTLITFGVSGAAVESLLGIRRICPCGR